MQYDVAQQMNGYHLLRAIDTEAAALVVMDPQYRAVLDKMAYGNEGAKQQERAKLPQMPDDMIRAFVDEAERILRPSGHLLFWTDKYSVFSGHHLRYFSFMSKLQMVDGIAWAKSRLGMGYRSRGRTEYLLILQKAPVRAKGIWTDHGIPDSWPEKQPPTHPHAKPPKLMRRLIESVTVKGDLVVDPCAGGFGVLDACREAERRFLGCDLMATTEGREPAGEAVQPPAPEEPKPSPALQALAATAPGGPSATSLLSKLRSQVRPMAGIPRVSDSDM